MAEPRNRQEFKERIYRDLGSPVISVNIDDSQMEDAIDDALSFWRDYHYDAQKKIYIAHLLTQTDLDTKQITLDPSISAVTRVFKFADGGASDGGDDIFNVDYQLRLNDLWDLTSVNMTGYVIARQYISLIDDILNTDIQIRYRELEGILYLDTAAYRLTQNAYIMIEAYQYLEGDGIWRSRSLRQLAQAYARRRWALHLIKFQDQALPGGVRMNGDRMLYTAQIDIQKAEEEFIRLYSAPDEFFIV